MVKFIRSITLLFVSFLFVVGSTLPVQALFEEDSVYRVVRVSTGINNALYLNADGKPEGYCADYLKALADINHWELVYVEGSWTESVERLANGEIDLLFPTQMTEERKSTMGFSTAIGGYQPIGLYASGESDLCYDDFEGFDGTRVALSAGTSNELVMNAYAEENGFTYEAVDMNTTNEKIDALHNGDVDLVVFSTLNDVPDGKVVALLDYLPFYYCTRIDNTELLEQLNYGMNQMILRNSDLVEGVFASFMNTNINFAFTKAEMQAIEAHGTIQVGVYQDTIPLFEQKEDGSQTGIYVDLVQSIRDRSGMDIQLVALDRKGSAFDYLKNGQVDFVLGTSNEVEGTSTGGSYNHSESIMDYYTVTVSSPSFKLDSASSAVYALTSARRYWADRISATNPNATYVYFPTVKECLDAVANGKADVTLVNTWEYNYQSKNQRYSSLIEWENTRVITQSVFTSLSNQDPDICSVMNKCIEQISNSKKEAIITSNLNVPYHSYNLQDEIYNLRVVLIIAGVIILVISIFFAMYNYMRKKTLVALQEKNTQLENANDAKDRFLSRMSHELRTPLNAINGYATVLEQKMDAGEKENSTEVRNALDAIIRASGYQLSIITDLLDIQQIETGKVEINIQDVEFAPYLESIVEMAEGEAKDHSISFSYEQIGSIANAYRMDAVRVQQVLLNILHNAVKFTKPGGKVKMTSQVVDQDEVGDTLKFVISDNGIGMSEDFQKNYLFHRFAQEYKGNTSPYEGTGVGLAISKEIIHLMGGEITCKSELGVGSTFTVILTVPHVEIKKRSGRNTTTPSYDLSGIHVLLCEDNQMNQDIERRLLERMHCTVELADDGEIGLQKFQASPLDSIQVVLMDIRMPVMDGLAAAKAIRALDRADAKTVPILAVSANAFDEDIQKSLEAGMNEHLAKPVDVRILYDRIRHYCIEKEV